MIRPVCRVLRYGIAARVARAFLSYSSVIYPLLAFYATPYGVPRGAIRCRVRVPSIRRGPILSVWTSRRLQLRVRRSSVHSGSVSLAVRLVEGATRHRVRGPRSRVWFVPHGPRGATTSFLRALYSFYCFLCFVL